MRGIRIWHLAALALTVPLLAANVPSGCVGGLNPNFVAAMGGDAASGAPIPKGYVVLGYFNYTGFWGEVTFTETSNSTGRTTAWIQWLYPDKPTFYLWACDEYLSELDLTGGNIDVVDPATGQIQQVGIQYSGGVLGGTQLGEPLECGTLIKANVRFIGTDPRIDVELIK